MPFVVAADGVRIHYELEGPAAATPLVLLHGFASRIESWLEAGYVDRLRDQFHVLLVDIRGNGESDKPTRANDYAYRTRVLDVTLAMNAVGIDRAHLWGYSMGGQIAQSASVHAPERFTSYVIGGSSPYGARDFATQGSFDDFLADRPVPPVDPPRLAPGRVGCGPSLCRRGRRARCNGTAAPAIRGHGRLGTAPWAL
jgi:pimeloyl-ACP methyl ester carboxylesterase